MLKRILENQLHLHDEGNPAWGSSGGYEDQEAKDIKRLVEAHKTKDLESMAQLGASAFNSIADKPNFAKRLKKLSAAFVSPKLDKVKIKLEAAATAGYRSKTFEWIELDDFTKNWLRQEGLKVEEKWSGTKEEGHSYYEISW